jgi:glycosyltransferase involved in cell wall biosynthesis
VIQLSAVIITYNEERNIARCLDSLREIADEIIVVDSYSTDKTVEICNSLGVKVFQNKFEGHIQQKNFAVEKASFFYVLSLDADEVLSDELRTSIASAKSDWKYDAYEMNRLTNYCGAWIRHCGWYPDRKIRLFDKRKGKWTGVNPHDRYELNESNAPCGYLHGDILHYSYYSISGHIKQADYFTEISARVLFEQRRKASFLRLIVSPAFRFVRDYVLKSGFLDGYYGFVVCKISSYAVFLKYAKLRELWKQERISV